MDYTKDAILVREGFRSEPVTATHDEVINSGAAHHGTHQHLETFSMGLSNGSEMLEKNGGEPNLGQIFLTKMNGSILLSSLSPPVSSSEEQFDVNETMEYIPMSMRPETYIVPVLFAIIFIIGVIGNGTLIVIFIKERSMRNVPNMFIVSLAIGDLLVILFCVPFTSTVYTVDSWPYGLVVCKFSEFIKDLSIGVSVFTLTALSADRYFAIVDPMRKLTGRRATRITIISIIGIWTLAILVALPKALYSYIRVFPEVEEGEEEEEHEEDEMTFQVCYPYPTKFGKIYAQVMVMFHFLVYYAVPLFFIATFYIIMARHLVLSTRNMPGEAQGQAKQIQARKKVAKMILSFVVIFAICFFPHHLFLLWFYFNPDSENSFNAFWNICRILGFCLSFMNSCINPITLYCVSGTFRKQFNEHLFCCFCDEPGSRPSRGGRFSHGGTLNGGGGGGHGGGLCAACVSLSGNGQMYGNDSRYGNGSLGRGGNGRMYRGSTWDSSDRMMSKRKSTWETQTTVVNNRLANIHVNLCSEHEHIPLKTLTHNKAMITAVQAGANQPQTGIISEENLGQNGHQAYHSGITCSRNKRRASLNNLTTVDTVDKHTEGCSQEEIQQTTKLIQNRLSGAPRNFPSLIEEETSISEQEHVSTKNKPLSPSKSYAKVGEIFSKISNKYANNATGTRSPVKQGSHQSSSPKKSPTKHAPKNNELSALLPTNEMEQNEMAVAEMNYNNNLLRKQSPEESTVTCFITVPQDDERGPNLEPTGNVIICYN